MQIEQTKKGAEFVRTGRVNTDRKGNPATHRQIENGDYYVHAQMMPVSPQRFERIHASNIKK